VAVAPGHVLSQYPQLCTLLATLQPKTRPPGSNSSHQFYFPPLAGGIEGGGKPPSRQAPQRLGHNSLSYAPVQLRFAEIKGWEKREFAVKSNNMEQ